MEANCDVLSVEKQIYRRTRSTSGSFGLILNSLREPINFIHFKSSGLAEAFVKSNQNQRKYKFLFLFCGFQIKSSLSSFTYFVFIAKEAGERTHQQTFDNQNCAPVRVRAENGVFKRQQIGKAAVRHFSTRV